MTGLLVSIGVLVGICGLLMLVAYLRRDTHCMECGGRLDVPVWHCTHERFSAMRTEEAKLNEWGLGLSGEGEQP